MVETLHLVIQTFVLHNIVQATPSFLKRLASQASDSGADQGGEGWGWCGGPDPPFSISIVKKIDVSGES